MKWLNDSVVDKEFVSESHFPEVIKADINNILNEGNLSDNDVKTITELANKFNV